MHTPIKIEWDGKFTISYSVGEDCSAIRVLPELGRLIAAAPTMRTALESAASQRHICGGQGNDGQCFVDLAKAAIATAEGTK